MDANTQDAQGTGISAAEAGLNLPADIELLEKLGGSKLTTVWRARHQGEDVVVKAYSDKAAAAWRKKLDKNIGVFEMLQNRAFRHQPELVNYTAKPIRVIGQDGKHSLCFLQEYIDGVSLEEVARTEKGLPGAVIRTGETIARVCEEKGIKGVDQFMADVIVRRQGDNWIPVIHDFKHIPEEPRKKSATSPLFAKLGFGSRPGAATGFMKDWLNISRRFSNG
ncbi:hypothetical protein F3N42_11190 [Marinihelvus fidelis]|uniref:Protein kinase domain-containing protein n=1 Tax=Marinihelvus fidelis TaxID=2613842 RepID=A0A5N0T8W1_9GAMM|nr:hypothetical protein [Marinihelvus fidelis]KAA9130914.1 hypothetical protein F3N42_11190 [Marinihelvus fidelis]